MARSLIIWLMLFPILLAGQEDSVHIEADSADLQYVHMKVVDGDTLLYYYVDDVMVMDEGERLRYDWLLARVIKVYPLAVEAANNVAWYNEEFAKLTGKEQKRFMKRETERLKDEFRVMIEDMSESEGHVLCKLMHRESGMTAYDILKTYRGTVTAFTWQTVSKMGGADLLLEHDPEGEDFLLEYIVRQIERGEIYVDMDALTDD